MGLFLGSNLISPAELKSSVEIDNNTITENSQGKIQSVGIKESRTDTTINFWHGTQSQWEQGDGILYYNWHNQGLIEREPIESTSSEYIINTPIFVDGKFIAISSNNIIESFDGINWSIKSTIPGSGTLIYGNNTFIIYTQSSSSGTLYKSSDLINWTQVDISSYGYIKRIVYGNNIFMMASTTKLYTSSDASSWTDINASVTYIKDIATANNAFAIIDQISSSNLQAKISTDNGATWNNMGSNLYSRYYDSYPMRGVGNIFFWGGDGIRYVTNDNGVTINNASSMSSNESNYSFNGTTYFLYNSRKIYTSSDGITWVDTNISTNRYLSTICYGNGLLLIIGYNHDNSTNKYYRLVATYTDDNINYYTIDKPASSQSTVYSDINQPTSITIINSNNDSILLSNNKIGFYNASGNKSTAPSVGTAHPEWVCFIDGVGIKIGNTIIADNFIQS